jgi:hypothetical protein
MDARIEEPDLETAEDEFPKPAELVDESPADLALPTAQEDISEGLPEATD